MLVNTKRNIAQKKGFAMLAPLWTDNDARKGKVYYHIYDLTQPGSTRTDKARVKVSWCELVKECSYDKMLLSVDK